MLKSKKMSYTEFYNLKEQPFTNSPDNKFYFDSNQHREAIVRINHVIDNMLGLAVLVGEIGAGKTTIARKLLDSLDVEKYSAGMLVIIHSDVSSEWILKKISAQMGVKKLDVPKDQIMKQLMEKLTEIHQEGKKAVIIVDESNMLRSREVMEEFRGLLNLETPQGKLLTFILIGLPELDEWLYQDKPLRQRMALRFTLHALNPSATKSYIQHRLSVAGREKELFTEDTFRMIYDYSKGIPRLINIICDNALLEGFLTKQEIIEPKVIEDVAIGLGL